MLEIILVFKAEPFDADLVPHEGLKAYFETAIISISEPVQIIIILNLDDVGH
jgi:hypothetical protein